VTPQAAERPTRARAPTTATGPNDCDGTVDESDAWGATAWYADADGDGVGVDATEVFACDGPSGYAPDAGDCDNADPAVHPGSEERCSDGVDNDCDGTADGSSAGCGLGLSEADAILSGAGAADRAVPARVAASRSPFGDVQRDGATGP